MDNRLKDAFAQLRKRAKEMLQDRPKLAQLIEQARKKAEKHPEALHRPARDLFALLRMLKAWAQGTYVKVPWNSLLSAVCAVIYFVNPFDLIPDFIVGGGYFDDVAILTWVLGSMAGELDAFRKWESERMEDDSETTQPPTVS